MIVILDVIMREKVTKMYNYIIYTELKSSRLHTHVHFTSNSTTFNVDLSTLVNSKKLLVSYSQNIPSSCDDQIIGA